MNWVFGSSFTAVFYVHLFAPFGIVLTARARKNQNSRSLSLVVKTQHKTYNFQLKNIKQFDDCATDSRENKKNKNEKEAKDE
jgi:hypothetical protein